MKPLLVALLVCGAVLAAGCGKEQPELVEGAGAIVVLVADTSGLFPGSISGEPFFLEKAAVTIESRTHLYAAAGETDESGVAAFGDLSDGVYSVFARREVIEGAYKVVFSGFADLRVEGEAEASDTIFVKNIRASSLVINEVFYSGSCGSSYYFYDQFVELYNASSDTLYLDNLIVTRQLGTIDPDMETKDYVRAIYAFQLKGTGRQWPIAPAQFAVIAADAVNHRVWCPNGVDLSQADYECFNALGNDYDAPAANFESISNRTTDFLINLVHNAVVIASGEEWTIDENNYVRIPVANVIDGVEYSANQSAAKELTVRIDAGFAGVNVTRYSATSVERREPGLDTNNSTFDFVNTAPPTPGFSHGAQARMRLR